ncbi:MAG: hypothetical protein K2X61_08225 [Caulobacteraceae bacterium]|nr:hypothetical protein [Caulobacteraceae bacterium]
MTLLAIRTERGLTLAQCAVELGLSASSSSWISEIENGKRDASLRLALRIERWSGGRVPAHTVCAELRREHEQASSPDAPTMAPAEALGAGAKTGAVQ